MYLLLGFIWISFLLFLLNLGLLLNLSQAVICRLWRRSFHSNHLQNKCLQTFTRFCVCLSRYFNIHFTAMYRIWMQFGRYSSQTGHENVKALGFYTTNRSHVPYISLTAATYSSLGAWWVLALIRQHSPPAQWRLDYTHDDFVREVAP